MAPEQRRRPWYHPRTLVGAWGRGGYPQDERVRKAGGTVAKLAGLTLIAYVLASGLIRVLDRQPAQITAAIKEAAAIGREGQQELRGDLKVLTAAVRDSRAGEEAFRAEMRGLAAGRYKCPPPTIIRLPGPTVVVERPAPSQRCEDAPASRPVPPPEPSKAPDKRSRREW